MYQIVETYTRQPRSAEVAGGLTDTPGEAQVLVRARGGKRGDYVITRR